MDNALYYDHLYEVLSRYSIPDLIHIWRISLYHGSQGVITRSVITKHLEALAKYHGLQLSHEPSFRELVEAYDEKYYNDLCPLYAPICLMRFTKQGDLLGVKTVLRKKDIQKNDIFDAFEVSLETDTLEVSRYLVDYLLQKGMEFQVMKTIAKKAGLEIAKYAILKWRGYSGTSVERQYLQQHRTLSILTFAVSVFRSRQSKNFN